MSTRLTGVSLPKVLLLIFLLFGLSRYFIFTHPPANYSDVRADYERYANMWRYGLTPYLEHLYEYPPATIPLLSLPLELDQRGIGKYYPNYRRQILVVDALFFALMIFTLVKQKKAPSLILRNSIAYIILTIVAKDFLYEGLDLVFTASFLSALMSLWWLKTSGFGQQLLMWVLFWLSTALKFLTIPLMIPLWLATRKNTWQDYLAPIFGFFIIWGIPLLLFGSSLQVSFIYNNARPIKYASLPAHIIEWVNTFTQTETQRYAPPDFAWEGPVSTTVTNIVKIVFPLALLSWLTWSGWEILKTKKNKLSLKLNQFVNTLREEFLTPNTVDTVILYNNLLKIYGVFIFTLFLSAKIFSQPFHIWYLPLIMLFPFKNPKTWWCAFGLMLFMVIMDMTLILKVPDTLYVFEIIRVSLMRHTWRFIPMFVMLGIFINTPLMKKMAKTTQ